MSLGVSPQPHARTTGRQRTIGMCSSHPFIHIVFEDLRGTGCVATTGIAAQPQAAMWPALAGAPSLALKTVNR